MPLAILPPVTGERLRLPAAMGRPRNYTYTPRDAGEHPFRTGASLKTAGSQSISATETVTSSITGKQTVNVQPAAAQSLLIAGFPSPTTAGASHSFTVTAKDAY